MSLSRGNRGTIKLNNISVYSYEDAQITPHFSQRKVTLSLEPHLKSIIKVENKSLYCSASFNDTEVTLLSVNPGKTFIYFDGILQINDNRALVLIIVTINERGGITYDENLYVFSTNTSFNIIPTTVQKEFQTYSSINGFSNHTIC